MIEENASVLSHLTSAISAIAEQCTRMSSRINHISREVEGLKQPLSTPTNLPMSRRLITGKTLTLSFRLEAEKAYRVEQVCQRLKLNKTQFFKKATDMLLECDD
jgi:hypothetical protein|tara:strand:+ start:514 stop:825 length:312 start_codon:yes stop_codon:yes gene_type:complete